jgi:GNAT superfamily N-acetyltransferase
VDYALEVTPALVERWQSALLGAQKLGFEIVPLRDWPAEQRAGELCEIWNETFASHFGWSPFNPGITGMFVGPGSAALDTSVFAVAEGRVVGFCFVLPDDASHAGFAPGRLQRPAEKLNVLAIGVRQTARGRGLNYAMASYAFLELVGRGWTHLSYTLVLDDNWASRRTGEGLGASLCANYVAYRRNLRGGSGGSR